MYGTQPFSFCHPIIMGNNKLNLILTFQNRTDNSGSLTYKYFPEISRWISEFLGKNGDMTASLIGNNMLVRQVLYLDYVVNVRLNLHIISQLKYLQKKSNIYRGYANQELRNEVHTCVKQ